MLATSAGEWVHCGRVFSATEIAELCATVAWLPGLARKELAATVCEHLGWTTLTGTAKISACLEFLERLQAAGLLVLPALRPSPPRRCAPPSASVAPVAEPAVHCALSALAPVSLEVVRDATRVAQWDALVARWHPLGFQGAFGYRLRYFITAGDRRLGCVLLSGAARAVAVRDRWIGWTAQARRENLARVVNNSRFLIFPHVRVPHLASHVLGQLARRARADWLDHWGFEPLLLETFVDPRHYAGTCYRAAGWQLLGATSGRGLARPGQSYHSTPRQVWVKPLTSDCCDRLCAAQPCRRPTRAAIKKLRSEKKRQEKGTERETARDGTSPPLRRFFAQPRLGLRDRRRGTGGPRGRREQTDAPPAQRAARLARSTGTNSRPERPQEAPAQADRRCCFTAC
jgi:hypothetical protein